MMTSYVITEDGRAFALKTNRRSEHEALCDLFEKLKGCFEIRAMGARKEPVEVTASWLRKHCREVELF